MVRITSKNAGFQLTFYASTVILNHSDQNIKLYYDTINRTILAG